MVLHVITGAFAGLGTFLVLADVLKLPTRKVSKAFLAIAKRQRERVSRPEMYLENLSGFIAGKLRLNEYRKMQLQADLQTAGLDITPEMHLARALVKAGLTSLLIVPAIFVFPLVAPVAVALVFAVYFKESRGIQDRIKRKRLQIESELVRLVFIIEKTIGHNRDVLAILDNYKEKAGEKLEQELNITVADMRSGNYEVALTRLETRVGSAMLSDVVRGLISVIRGDETKSYWEALSIKFADHQRQVLKQEALRVPSKIRRLSMILMFCFLLFYLVVILVEILNSLGAMFG